MMSNLSYIPPTGSSVDLIYDTVPHLLDIRAADMPNKPAHIFRTLKSPTETSRVLVTFKDLADQSLRLASSFLSLGIQPKERIALIGSNCPEYLLVDYACIRISVLLIRLPASLLSPDVLLRTLEKFAIKTLILDDEEMFHRVDTMLPDLLMCWKEDVSTSKCDLNNVVLLRKVPSDSYIPKVEPLYVEDLCNCSEINKAVYKIQESQLPDESAVVYPTSGSTGDPKFAVYSHFGMINTLQLFLPRSNSDNTDSDSDVNVFLSDRPFSWMGGQSLRAVATGLTTVNLDPSASQLGNWAEIIRDLVKEEGVTEIIVMPKGLYDLMSFSGELDAVFSDVAIITGGEQVPEKLLQFARDTFGTVCLCYGSTEVAVSRQIFHQTEMENIEEIYWMGTFAFVEVKVVDEDGKLVPLSQTGHVYARGLMSMTGYLDDPLATKATIDPNGWIRTGDLGSVNSDHRLKISGRDKDVISKGGNKIYPITIEKMLADYEKIAEVAVIDVPDPRLYHEICSCVIPKAGVVVTEEELRDWCQRQVLTETAFLKPKYFLIMEDFPRTTTHKIDKKVLRKKAERVFNL